MKRMPTKDDLGDKVMSDEQMDEKVKQIMSIMEDTNYMGEVVEIIHRFLLTYAAILKDTNIASYAGTAWLIDDWHTDLMDELKKREVTKLIRKKRK